MKYFVLSMILFAVAGAALVSGIIMRRKYGNDTKFHLWAWLPITAFAILLLFISMIFSVPKNHIGVEDQWGEVIEIHSEGLNLKSPFSNIIIIPGTQQELTYSAVQQEQEGEENRQDPMEAVTRDNALVDVDMTILWSLDLNLAKSIYREYRNLDNVRTKLLRPTTIRVVLDCVAEHALEEARTSERATIASCTERELRDETSSKGVSIRAVQIRSISAKNSELQASIDKKLAAEQSAREAEFLRDKAAADAQIE